MISCAKANVTGDTRRVSGEMVPKISKECPQV